MPQAQLLPRYGFFREMMDPLLIGPAQRKFGIASWELVTVPYFLSGLFLEYRSYVIVACADLGQLRDAHWLGRKPGMQELHLNENTVFSITSALACARAVVRSNL